MKSIIIEPMKHPRIVNIDSDLKTLQNLVGGTIQAVYPFDDPVCIICNDDGKLLKLPFNRALKDTHGEIIDILVGTFLITGLTEEDFGDLSDELAKKYVKLFQTPEMLMKLDNRIIVLPATERSIYV